MPRFGPWPASLKSIPSTLARSWCRCARQVIQKKTKTWHKALSFVLKIGITIHKISTFWPKKNPVECFSLALRIWASESMATHRWAEKEIRTRHGLRRIDWFRFSQNSQRCEFWCLPNAMLLYVAICCYMLLYNVAPPSCKLVYEIINTIVIGVINQLSYLGGPTLYVAMFCFLAADTKYVSSMFHCFWINLKLIHTRTENSNVCFSCFLCNSLWCNSA